MTIILWFQKPILQLCHLAFPEPISPTIVQTHCKLTAGASTLQLVEFQQPAHGVEKEEEVNIRTKMFFVVSN